MTAQDLPIKTGPKRGARAFSEEEELSIAQFVAAGNSRELAAVITRTTKQTIDNIVARVKKKEGPGSDKPRAEASPVQHGAGFAERQSTCPDHQPQQEG